MRFKVSKKIWLWWMVASACSPALAFAQSLTIQGKVTNSAGQPVIGAATKFRVQIYAPDSANHCVLYDETHIVDLSQSYGLFSINLGEVNPARVSRDPPTTYSLEQAISNRAALTVNGTYCSPNVSGVATYVPTSTDNRKVLIQFVDPATMGTSWETIPEMDLNPVAYAMDARTVGGYPASTVLRVVNASGVPAAFPALTSAEAAELQNLAAGTSNKYLAKNATAGVQIPTGAPSAPAAGSIWFEAGTLKYSDGSTVQTLGTGSGTLSSVVGGAGITASVTSGTATVGLTASGVGAGGSVGSATSIPEIQYDTYGRITGVTPHAISGLLPAAGADHQVLMSNGGSWGASFVGMADLRKDAGTPLFPGTCAINRTLNWNSVSGVFECVDLGSIASSQLAAPTGAAAGTYRSVSVNAAGQVLSGTNPTTLSGYAISDGVQNGGSVPRIRSGAADPSGAGVDGELYVATGSQKIFRYNLGTTTWETMASAGGAGGTMTGITAGTGIAVSGSATTPAVSLSTTGVTAGTFAKVTTDAYGRVTSGSAQVGDADIADVAFSKLTGKPATLAGHGITEALVSNAGGAASLQAGATSGRPSPGIAGQIYIDTDTNTVYYRGASTWQTVASAAGSGGTLTEVYSGAGVNVTGSGTTRTVALTDVGTASTGLVKVNTDAKGRVTGGATTIGNADISDLAFSKLTGTPTTVGGYGITDAVKNTDGTVPNILSGDDGAKPAPAAGNLNYIYIANDTQRIYRQISGAWQVIGAGTTANFSGSLAGEVSGTQGATQVDQIGSFLRATILSLFTNVQNATEVKTNGAIVKRDGAGGFAVGAITADTVVLKGTTSGTATLRAPATVTTYDVQLPASAPTAGQVLSATSGTALTWTTPLSGSTINVAAPITNTSGTIGINTASGSQAGALSSADWTTFNNKLGTALTAASIWVGNASNVATAVAPSGDVAVSNAGAFTVNGIKGQNISAAGATAGQVLRYAGSNTWTPNFVSMADLRSTVTGTQAITGNCTASQTLTWNSGSDNLQCQSISIAAATQLTGVLPVANGGTGAATVTGPLIFAGPASGTAAPSFRALAVSDLSGLANQWAESSGNVFRTTGSVGIGTSSPSGVLHVVGSPGSGTSPGLINVTALTDNAYQNSFTLLAPNLTTGHNNSYILGRDASSNNAFNIGYTYVGSGLGTNYLGIQPYGQATALAVSAAGTVGIGTTAPGALLDAYSASSTAFMLRARTGASSGFGGSLKLDSTSMASGRAWTIVSGGSSDPVLGGLNFYDNTAGTNRMVIDAAGNVGVGANNPAYGLDVAANNGSFRVIGSTGGITAVRATAASSAPDLMLRKSRGTASSPAIVSDGDYLGHISFGGYDGADYATYPAGIFAIVKGTPAAGSIPSELGLSAGTSGLHPSNERVRITSTGRVGIATTAPQAGLDIATTGAASAIIVPRDNTTNRPTGAAAINGMIRYNTTSNALEAYIGGAWSNLATVGGSSSFTTVGAGAGSAGSPSLSFSGDSNTGFYNTNSDDTISVATNGAKIFDFSSSGLVSPTTGGAAVSSANGTAATPTYGFAGDAGLGWFRPAAQTLAAATAGVERVRIDSTGRFGVGTSSPGYPVHVTKTSEWPVVMDHEATTATHRTHFLARRSRSYGAVAAGDTLGGLGIAGHDGTNFTLGYNGGAEITGIASEAWTSSAHGTDVLIAVTPNGGSSNVERMRITQSGNIGIGTSVPLSKLHLQDYSGGDQLTLHGNSTTGNKTGVSYRVDSTNLWDQYTTSDGSAFNFKLDYMGANKVLVTPGGNVGIGTSIPGAKLSVRQSADDGSDGVSLGAAGSGGMMLYHNGAGAGRIKIGTSDTLTMTNAGNVGVSTADPTLGDTGIDASWRALTVAGPATAGASIAGLTLASQKSTTAANDRLGAIHFMAPNNSSASSNKYMGIIDTFAEGSGGANGFGAFMRFVTKGDNTGYAERMRITSAGLVGISNPNPRERLDLGGIAFHHGGSMGVQFNQYYSPANNRTEYMGYGGTKFSSSIGFDPNAGSLGFSTSASAGALGAAVDGGTRMTITAGGNVGIGTTSPSANLHIVTGSKGIALDTNTHGSDAMIQAKSATTSNWVRFGTNGSPLALITKGSDATSTSPSMFIQNNGYVGIGTVTPAAQLEVATSGAFPLYLLQNGYAGTRWQVGPWSNTNHFYIIDENSVGMYLTKGNSGIGWSVNSDRRLKKDIRPLEESRGLASILRLKPVTYQWRDEKIPAHEQTGFIAQEVQEIFPDLVSVGKDNEITVNGKAEAVPSTLGVNYTGFIIPLVKAVQELKAQLDTLVGGSAKQAREIAALRSETEKLRRSDEAKNRDLASLKARAETSEQENAALKARMDKLEKLLNARTK